MRKIWVYKATSFDDARHFNRGYYFSMSSSQRLETMQMLRESFKKLKNGKTLEENGKRLRRVINVTKPT